MQTEATTQAPAQTGADTIAVGVFDGEDIAHDVAGGTLQKLLDRGEARRAFKRLAVVHAEDRRYVIVGLGDRAHFDTERARVVAAAVHGRARELSTQTLCWEAPHHLDDAHVGALVEGTVLAAYRFDKYRNHPDEDGGAIQRLVVSAHHPVDAPVAYAATVATAQNRARDLQNTPSNELTPERLAHRAHELVAEVTGVSLEVRGEDEIGALGMGAFAAVARGSHEEARLIELSYEGPDARGPLLALVGKAVTFDSGGISIKPAMRMSEMKFDMSGGAVVLEAIGAIARLQLPIRVLGLIGATENMPSGHAMRPGDIVRAANGTTIEVVNTDAEGRLVLADCLAHAVNHGAERIVDLATLTGAIVTTFGSSHAGLFANDDAWADALEAAAGASGDLLWRLPLHTDYADAIKGRYADIVNSTENRKAASITAAEFLHRFVGDVPWAHLDIAGTANDTGRPYAGSGGSGYGVRLLVELARRLAD
jgi:leucyl aminopeptidase